MKDLRLISLSVSGAAVVGAFSFGLGYLVHPSPEPEVRTVTETHTVTETQTETVDVPYLPESCAKIPKFMAKTTKHVLIVRHDSAIVPNLAQTLRVYASLDMMPEYNKAVSAYVNQQRVIENAGMKYMRIVQRINAADSECEADIESGN